MAKVKAQRGIEMCKKFEELLACRREVKRLEENNAGLLVRITELVAEQEQPPKPKIELLSIGGDQVREEVVGLGLKLMYPGLMDGGQPYLYTNDKGWAEVFDYIYCVFDMPSYIASRMDCEDFGILLKGLVSALFGLNYFAFTVGQIPQGCHGFNFFKTENGLMIMEPQLAQFFEWGERGYKPQWALL